MAAAPPFPLTCPAPEVSGPGIPSAINLVPANPVLPGSVPPTSAPAASIPAIPFPLSLPLMAARLHGRFVPQNAKSLILTIVAIAPL